MTSTTDKTEKKETKKTDLGSKDSNQRKQSNSNRDNNKERSSRPKNPRRDNRGGRPGRSRPEFDNTVLDIRRVTRVVAGGRRFSFRVSLVAGDHKGRVGVGVGKASDTPLAIEKAFRDAKRKMITVVTTKNMSIPCESEAKFSASRVFMKPSPGKGIIAGGAVRPVIELAGLQDVTTKLLSRSKNSLNNARAAIKALEQLSFTSLKNSRKHGDDEKSDSQDKILTGEVV